MSDVLEVTDPLGVVAVAGSVGAVGMTGFTLGGGYGALIGRFGLAVDNLLAAEVVLADGRIVSAKPGNEEELYWALRGGGGNFGVVTAMEHRLHGLSGVCSGMLLFPFAEARAILEACADIAASAPEELTAQLGFAVGRDGVPVIMIVPTWCGPPAEGEARVAPFLKLGTLLAGAVEAKSYGASLTTFDPYLANGQRAFMETCWLPELDSIGINALIETMAAAPCSPMSSGAPRHACQWRRRPLAFVATICSSRSSRPSPIAPMRSRSSDTGGGLGALFGHLIPWPFRVAIRTSLLRATPSVRRRATAPMPPGS